MPNEPKDGGVRRVPMNVGTWIRKLDLMTLRLFASITEERKSDGLLSASRSRLRPSRSEFSSWRTRSALG